MNVLVTLMVLTWVTNTLYHVLRQHTPLSKCPKNSEILLALAKWPGPKDSNAISGLSIHS